jgi:hypothetical protein
MPLLETFTSPPPEEPDEPLWVVIEGTYGARHPKAGKPWEEQFTLIPEIPPGLEALWLQTAASTGRSTEYKAGAVISFLGMLFDQRADKSHTRFMTLTNDPDRLVRLDLLVEVMHSAVKALTGRPTGPATSSSPGQPETETGSTPESPSQDETPEPSPSGNSSTGSSRSSSKQPRKRAAKQPKS